MERGDAFRERLNMLLTRYPSVDTSAMGFPQNWENEPLWKGNDTRTDEELIAKWMK